MAGYSDENLADKEDSDSRKGFAVVLGFEKNTVDYYHYAYDTVENSGVWELKHSQAKQPFSKINCLIIIGNFLVFFFHFFSVTILLK